MTTADSRLIFMNADTEIKRYKLQKSLLLRGPSRGFDSGIHEPYFGSHEFTNDENYGIHDYERDLPIHEPKITNLLIFTNKFFNFHEFRNDIFSFSRTRVRKKPIPAFRNAAGGGGPLLR